MGRYTSEQARRHEIRPGITGLAQVDGRNGLSWEEKLRLDVSYVHALSFPLDIKSCAGRHGPSLPGRAPRQPDALRWQSS